ncbi:MAG: triacylglycerol lipase [Pseudonocardiales bacterium]|nr:triacylglycerol lipase [Pseudonocardiales bacterium]
MVLSAFSPARRRLVVFSVLISIAALVAGGIWTAVARAGKTNAVTITQAEPGPVLLVPGYGGSVTGLQALAARLRAAGKQVSIMSLPGNGTGDLREQAKALRSAARSVLSTSGASSLDVVGYSAGGVVARLWLSDYGGASVARRIITLGTPNHGTQLADLGGVIAGACPLACQQLAPNSSLLLALNRERPAAAPSLVSIWTTQDDVVLPPDSARLDGALDLTVQGICASSQVQHGGLPTEPLVAGMVLAELAAGAPVALTPADCARLSS